MSRVWTTLTAAALVFASPVTASAGMDDFHWSKRPILVFAESADSQQARAQVALFRETPAKLSDRQHVVISVFGAHTVTVNGKAANRLSNRALRSQYDVPENRFAVILIGKDGGEKLRVNEVVDPARIYGLVDRMPMRRQEMRQKQ